MEALYGVVLIDEHVLNQTPQMIQEKNVLHINKVKSFLKKEVCTDLEPIQKIYEEPLKKLVGKSTVMMQI